MRDRALLFAAVALLAAVIAVYSNHFHNAFHFDDFHTITNNPYIRNLSNVPEFFIDSRTFSSLPGHQSYRPLLTTSFALDYWLANGANPVYFQVSTFIWYLAQVALMYGVFLAVMDKAVLAGATWNRWIALFAVALYGLHPVCAETVNYVVQRGEILSSAGVLAGLLLYMRFPKLRRRGLYLVPVVAGVLAKAPAAMFAGILLTYILLFEEDRNIARSLRRALPAIAVCAAAVALVMKMEAGRFSPGGADPLLYRLTQPSVVWHYFRSFFWPSDLSADSDLAVVTGWSDPRVLLGFLFVAALCFAAWWTSRKKDTRPISLGLIWFLLALAPAAWTPLAEVANDHRMFFPFIGLTLAVVWTARLAARNDLRSPALAAAVVLAVCAYGVRQRNKVWRTEETLWRDVTLKSPRNGRGFMNYGLTQMEKGDFQAAMQAYEKALLFTPNYSLLYINLGIVKGALRQDTEAEQDFRRAIALAPADAQSYSFYSRWLRQHGRTAEAILMLESAREKNPADTQVRDDLLEVYSEHGDWAKLESLASDSLRITPNDRTLLNYRSLAAERLARHPPNAPIGSNATPEGLLTLSLAYYQAGRFEDCIRAARQALAIKADYAEAYNNIAAADNAMGRYDDGIKAATAAVRLKPDFKLASNNLAWAQAQKAAAARAHLRP